MAEGNGGGGSNTGIVAIVVIFLIVLVVGFLAYSNGFFGGRRTNVDINVNPPGGSSR